MKSSILTIDFLGAIQIRLLPDSNCLTTNDLLKNLLPVKVVAKQLNLSPIFFFLATALNK